MRPNKWFQWDFPAFWLGHHRTRALNVRFWPKADMRGRGLGRFIGGITYEKTGAWLLPPLRTQARVHAIHLLLRGPGESSCLEGAYAPA